MSPYSKYHSQEGDFVNASTFDIFRTWVTSEIPDMGPEQSLFITTKSKVFENFSAMCFNEREISMWNMRVFLFLKNINISFLFLILPLF